MERMLCGYRHFFAQAVRTLPNGELLFEPTRGDLPTPEDKRPGTAPLPPLHHTIPSLKNRLVPTRPVQPESNTANVIRKTGTSDEPVQENPGYPNPTYLDITTSRCLLEEFHLDQASLVPRRSTQPKSDTANVTSETEISCAPVKKIPGYPNTTHLDITTFHRSPEEIRLDQVAAKEDWFTPSFTPDTYILIRKADKASWIQIGDAISGATVVQSLPSGNIGDLGGAKLTTLQKLWAFASPVDGTDIVQIGKAYITANHPIQTVDGWMTASQAADRGHGKVLSDRVHSKFHSLQLVTGGNIIINTSASPDLPSTQIKAATMGYRFVPANLPNKNFPTYSLRRPASGTVWLPRPNQATPRLPNSAFRVCRVGQPHNQHL